VLASAEPPAAANPSAAVRPSYYRRYDVVSNSFVAWDFNPPARLPTSQRRDPPPAYVSAVAGPAKRHVVWRDGERLVFRGRVLAMVRTDGPNALQTARGLSVTGGSILTLYRVSRGGYVLTSRAKREDGAGERHDVALRISNESRLRSFLRRAESREAPGQGHVWVTLRESLILG
jgi:hypothetical protein